MLAVLSNVILPVMICIAIGYFWGRTPNAYATEFVARLITLIGAPCLIIATMNRANLDWNEFFTMARLTLCLLLGFLVTGAVLVRIFRLDMGALLLAVMIPNTGNMGLSLCLFAFGQQGLALGLIVFVVLGLLHFISGDVVLSQKGSLGERLMGIGRQPLVYAAMVSVFLVATGWKLPVFAASTLQLLGGMTIPLMLITLGVSLSRLAAANLKGGLLIALARLVVGLVVSLGLVWLFDIGGLMAKVLILQAMMPSAVFNYLFALKHNREPETVASGVVISTFLSFAVIPVLLWFLMDPAIFP